MKNVSAYLRGMRAAIYILLGNKCAMCGVRDRRVLEIDHIRGGGTRHRRVTGGGRAYLVSILRDLRAGRKRYRILCANHHALVTTSRSRAYRGERSVTT
jgi:hypothetical protein